MPTSCCAKLCAHNSKNCKLKIFPVDDKRAQAWEANLRRPSWQRKNHHRLCECHFEPDQFVNKKLRPDAVPTIFPTHKVTLHVYARRANGPTESLNSAASSVGSNSSSNCHFSEDQFFVSAEEGGRKLKGNAAPTVFETHGTKYVPCGYRSWESTNHASEVISEKDATSHLEDSEAISYLATAVLGEQGDSEHAETFGQMAVDKEDISAATITPLLDGPELFSRVLNSKSHGPNSVGTITKVPEPLINYIVSLQNELQQRKMECRKSKQEISELMKKVGKVGSRAVNGDGGKSLVNEYQIQDLQGKKVRGFAVGLSDLEYLYKKGVIPDTKTLKVEGKNTVENERNEYPAISNDNSDFKVVNILQAQVLALESERDILRSANSQLINEKATVLNELHKLKADHKRLLKEHWNFQLLNSQLNSDNEKLLESLKAADTSPND